MRSPSRPKETAGARVTAPPSHHCWTSVPSRSKYAFERDDEPENFLRLLRADKTYMKYSWWARRVMLFSPLDATPPTVAIWTTLANYYIYLGTAAGAVVTAYMLYYIMKNR